MAHDQKARTDRRSFLQAGALATASAMSAAPASRRPGSRRAGRSAPPAEAGQDRPRDHDARARALCASDDRVLRLAFASGVRTFDTAKVYGTEPGFKKWFEQDARGPQGDRPGHQGQPARAQRACWRCSTSGWRPWAPTTSTSSSSTGWATTTSLDDAINFVKGQEFKETADAIRKSGKAKFIGFSTHHKDRAAIIQAAAEAGIVDAIMLQYTPWLDKDSPLNKALDACLEEGDRPDLDEAGRRPVRRPAQGEHPRGGRQARCRCSRRRT